MNFILILLIAPGLLLGPAFGTEYNGIDMIDFEIIETTVIPVPYWINEPVDYSDIIKVKFKITNNGINYFKVYKDMFQIDLEDPSLVYRDFSRPQNDFGIDTYYPQYSEDFKLRFQDIPIQSQFEDCVLLNHAIPINQTKELTVCFDIKRKWIMQSVNLTGEFEYYLVMMDNKNRSSCPNCERVKLTSMSTQEMNTQEKIVLVLGNLSPLKQINMGKLLDEITCKKDFILLSNYDGKPACVKNTSMQKLIQRGWILVN